MPTNEGSLTLQANNQVTLTTSNVDNLFFTFGSIPDYLTTGDFIEVDVWVIAEITPGTKRVIIETTATNYSTINIPEAYQDLPIEVCFLPSVDSGNVDIWSYEDPALPCSCETELQTLQDSVNANSLLTTGIAINQLAQNAAIEGMAIAQGAAFAPITAGLSAGIPAATSPPLLTGSGALIPLLP